MELSRERKSELLGILLIVLAIILGIGLFSNLAGIVGTGLKVIFMFLTGKGAYLFPFLFIGWGAALIHSKRLKVTPRLVGLIILYITLLAFLHVLEVPDGNKIDVASKAAVHGLGGGIFGGLIAYFLRCVLGPAGTYVVLSAAGLVGFLLVFDILLASLLTRLKARLVEGWSKITNFFKEMGQSLQVKKAPKAERTRKANKAPKRRKKVNEDLDQDDEDEPFLQEFNSVKGGRVQREIAAVYEEADEYADDFSDDEDFLPRTEAGRAKPAANATPRARAKSGPYQLPPLKFLTSAPPAPKGKPEMQDRSQLLEQTLLNFGVQAKTVSVSQGPTITRYELQPAPGVKVSRIVNLADDLALALAASDVRIVAPIPGKAAVGVEVPNSASSMVKLRDIIEHEVFAKSKCKLPLALGVDIAGEAVVADMVGMPHLLVAGATGSGKSVCINTIILSILYKAKPDEVKILLVDPKKVEMAVYRDLPHLMAPVVTDPKKASAVLKLVVQEMERRYDLFANSGTRGIEDYNILMAKRREAVGVLQLPLKGIAGEGENQVETPQAPVDYQPLPYIVVIIDELADLMMVAANDVEDSICRLAQMARAAGIHLIIATQRPSVDVITGLIKANVPSRIAFAVSSQIDSRTILDSGGAEKLLGKGDMLFSPVGANKMRRVQGAFVSTEEVTQVVEFAKKCGEPDYASFQQLATEEVVEEDEEEERDELYEEAVRIVVTSSPSISTLQRRLKIGYARAARLIDTMEREGLVGPYAGSKPRELLVSEEEIESILRKR